MVPSRECLRHAARCEYRALSSCDPNGKAHWDDMALRWVRRAALAQRRKIRERVDDYSPQKLSGIKVDVPAHDGLIRRPDAPVVDACARPSP